MNRKFKRAAYLKYCFHKNEEKNSHPNVLNSSATVRFFQKKRHFTANSDLNFGLF